MALVFNPSNWDTETGNLKFEASMVYSHQDSMGYKAWGGWVGATTKPKPKPPKIPRTFPVTYLKADFDQDVHAAEIRPVIYFGGVLIPPTSNYLGSLLVETLH